MKRRPAKTRWLPVWFGALVVLVFFWLLAGLFLKWFVPDVQEETTSFMYIAERFAVGDVDYR